MPKRIRILHWVLPILIASHPHAQSGKIAGQTTDAITGEPLPGVNIAIRGTLQGAASNEDGYFSILNVRPGTYEVGASYVGYSPMRVSHVVVATGLTTVLDFALHRAVLEEGEVVVVAERPIVQPDVSANVATIYPRQFESVPVAGITEVLDLQAGIEPGMRIRGGDINEVAFVMDGINLRTGRDQDPFSLISYTALEQAQVQTGGFGAEYGNLRAGLVHLTTKEPPRTRYELDGLFRYRPVQRKSFVPIGKLPASLDDCGFGTDNVLAACDTYSLRPWIDPEVRLTGSATWDAYTQRQYANTEGWNALVGRLRGEGFDVTVDDMLAFERYTHRRNTAIQVPDFEADVTLGGPLLPVLRQRLGEPRFLLSYRGTQNAYVVPQDRHQYATTTWQGKLTVSPATGMRLTFHGMLGRERGVNSDPQNPQLRAYDGRLPGYPWHSAPRGLSAQALYGDTWLGLAQVDHAMAGLTVTHTVGSSTFYQFSLVDLRTRYRSDFGNLNEGTYLCPEDGLTRERLECPLGPYYPVPQMYASAGRLTESGRGRVGKDLDGNGHIDVTCFGGETDVNADGTLVPYCIGEAPFGFFAMTKGIHEEPIGSTWYAASTRDKSKFGLSTGRFELTTQINRSTEIRLGAELILGSYRVARSFRRAVTGEEPPFYQHLNGDPIQGAAFAQAKLEFEGMIANLGARLDYFDVNQSWWTFEPFDAAIRLVSRQLEGNVPKWDPGAQVYLSPRLGVSFPITANSKLYFNYGHFRQMQDAFSLFGIEENRSGGIDWIGTPSIPMQQTVAYELGFDQNLMDEVLLRLSGFYRDISAQCRQVTYTGEMGYPLYQSCKPWNYEDIRGFEVSLSKDGGRYVRGFANYTFTQTRAGDFGYSHFFQNPVEMFGYLRESTDYRQTVPMASPYARFNLLLLGPQDFGPTLAGMWPLSGWRANLLGEWRAGQRWVWAGGSARGPTTLKDNVQWRDFWNWNLRVSKSLDLRLGEVQLFLDIDNLLNRKHLWIGASFGGGWDWEHYLWSLHLPEDIFDDLPAVDARLPFAEKEGLPYLWVPGNDGPGDFREPGVPFQPIEAVASLEAQLDPNEVAWYWAKDTGTYSRWNGGAWEPVPRDELNKVLETKAYIDMPNLRYNTFLNPRSVRLGLRLRL